MGRGPSDGARAAPSFSPERSDASDGSIVHDDAGDGGEASDDRPRSGRDEVAPLVFASVVATVVFVGVAVATVGNAVRSADFDPQFNRTVVERAMAFGGTYYENGIVNRGPLELVPYDIAARLMSHDGYWFAIAAFAALASLCWGLAAYASAVVAGHVREVGVAAALVVFVHLTFSDADYAGVLYVRSITTALLALAWAILWIERAWTSRRRRVIAVVAVAALLGLAVQTLLATVFVGSTLAVVTLALVRERASTVERNRLTWYGLGAGIASFFSAHLWYSARGSFEEFWSGWFTYARFVGTGTGRSVGSQLTLGWDRLYAHYQERPMALAVLVGFAVVAGVSWRDSDRTTRVLHGGLLGWWAAAWLELVVSQRYSGHYFAVLALPTACMASVLAAHAARALMLRSRRPAKRRTRPLVMLFPLVAVVLAVYLSGPQHLRSAWDDFAKFDGVAAFARDRERFVSGEERSVRATLDLVSAPGDGLLAWTSEPWHYIDNERVPATRFSWNTFLLGEIYLGETSDEYVLEQTWEWFAEDLAQSEPVAFIDVDGDVEPNTPFAQVVDDDFRTVWDADSIPVALRNDIAEALLRPSAREPWSAPASVDQHAGWIVADTTARTSGEGDATGSLTLLQGCGRLDGHLSPVDGRRSSVLRLRAVDPAGVVEDHLIILDDGVVRSGSETVVFSETDVGHEVATFSIVVGARAAGLVLDEELVGAVSIAPGSRLVADAGSSVVLSELRTGPAPFERGCESP